MKTLFKKYLLFSFFSFVSWNYIGILFIPAVSVFLMIIIQSLEKKWYVFLIRTFCLVLILNISITFWLIQVSWREGILAFLANSLFMLFPIIITYVLSKKLEHHFAILFLILWVLFEILLTKWDLAWSWLTFGHAMGNMNYFVQWYSFTGVYLGTVWIIVSALLLNKMLKTKRSGDYLQLALVLSIPILFSSYLYISSNSDNKKEITVTSYIPSDNNKSNYLKTKKLYFDLIDYETGKYIVCPEVFLNPVNVYSASQQSHFFYLNKLTTKKPNTNLIFGAELKSDFGIINSIFVKNQKVFLFRAKQKYVPIREFTPKLFQKVFNVTTNYVKIDNDFTDVIKKDFGFTPLICFESIFSMFTAKSSTDSSLIILASSEAFMNNSHYGKKQYVNIVKLRAIESGRYIVKCSDQGISCVINQKGDIKKIISKEIENSNVKLLTKNTFYQTLLTKT